METVLVGDPLFWLVEKRAFFIHNKGMFQDWGLFTFWPCRSQYSENDWKDSKLATLKKFAGSDFVPKFKHLMISLHNILWQKPSFPNLQFTYHNQKKSRGPSWGMPNSLSTRRSTDWHATKKKSTATIPMKTCLIGCSWCLLPCKMHRGQNL